MREVAGALLLVKQCDSRPGTSHQAQTTDFLLLYYITDRAQFPGSESERREQLLARIAEAARAGVDFIQVREKELSSTDLESLSFAAVKAVRENGEHARILINSRTDVAIACGADGVHLRSKDISPADVRRIWRAAGNTVEPFIATSCHADHEVEAAKSSGADLGVFGPVFEKSGEQGSGLSALAKACTYGFPILALGGATLENAALCMTSGAAGIAGIRLFQRGDLASTVRALRS